MATEAAAERITEVDWTNSGVLESLSRWNLLPFSHRIGACKAAELFAQSAATTFADNKHARLLACAEEPGSWLLGLRKLQWDSEFFGFKIGKIEPLVSPHTSEWTTLNTGVQLVREAIRGAHEKGFEQLLVQIHVADWQSRLALDSNGFKLADTIVCYERDLRDWKRCAVDNIREARTEDSSILEKISGDCFSNPNHNANRFVTDPQFDRALVRRMYELWLAKSLTGQMADKVFVYCDADVPIGFITIDLPRTREHEHGIKLAKIPLNAVSPDHHRKGIYTQLVKHALNWLSEQDVDAVEIKTQLPNVGVHSCWQRLAGRNAYSFYTFHLNLRDHKA